MDEVLVKLQVNYRGSTTIPSKIRKQLGINPGDKILVKIVGVVQETVVPVKHQELDFETAKKEVLLFLKRLNKHPQKKSWITALNHDLVTTLATKLGLTIISVRQTLRDPEITAELEKLGIMPIKKVEGA